MRHSRGRRVSASVSHLNRSEQNITWVQMGLWNFGVSGSRLLTWRTLRTSWNFAWTQKSRALLCAVVLLEFPSIDSQTWGAPSSLTEAPKTAGTAACIVCLCLPLHFALLLSHPQQICRRTRQASRSGEGCRENGQGRNVACHPAGPPALRALRPPLRRPSTSIDFLAVALLQLPLPRASCWRAHKTTDSKRSTLI
eukprot:3290360-Rhodomonas_salina.2